MATTLRRTAAPLAVLTTCLLLGCGTSDPSKVGVAMRWHGSWAAEDQAALVALVERSSVPAELGGGLHYQVVSELRADRDPVDPPPTSSGELEVRVLVDVYAADALVADHQGPTSRAVAQDQLRIALYPEATASLMRAVLELGRQLEAPWAAAMRAEGSGDSQRGCVLGACRE